MKLKEKNNFNQKMKTIEKLFNAGFNTDKKIMCLKLEDLNKIANLQANETATIIEFKNAVKSKQIINFLSGGENNEKISARCRMGWNNNSGS